MTPTAMNSQVAGAQSPCSQQKMGKPALSDLSGGGKVRAGSAELIVLNGPCAHSALLNVGTVTEDRSSRLDRGAMQVAVANVVIAQLGGQGLNHLLFLFLIQVRTSFSSASASLLLFPASKPEYSRFIQ